VRKRNHPLVAFSKSAVLHAAEALDYSGRSATLPGVKSEAIYVAVYCLVLALMTLAGGCVTAGAGRSLPEGTLNTPTSGGHAAYLGLSSQASTFVLEDVKADVVIVQIFDVYCRICQKAAPGANVLYERIQSSRYADKIKMLAVGTGDTQLEVDLFAERFATPFPSIPDPEKTFCMAIGYTRTPEFVVMKRTEEGTFREIARRVSYFTDAGRMLEWIIRRAGWE